MQKVQITQEKREDLERELKRLIEEVRPNILEKVATARAHGDLRENAEYHAARNAQAKNEGRIQEIEHILKNAEIIERSHSGIAELGATIAIKKSGEEEEKVYTLVGPQEADMATGKLSTTSPLGSALFGGKAGDTVLAETPRGQIEYTIIRVE